MKVVLANLFNHNGKVVIRVYDEKEITREEIGEFDVSVQELIKRGFTIKTENANERGEYSLWFEKVQDPAEAKRLQDERTYFEKMNTLTGVHLDDFRTEPVSKASENDDAYTKMIAEKIAKGEIDYFKQSTLPSED